MYAAKSILLVEDNEHDQYFFTMALEEIENATLYAVANNGKEALEWLEKQNILPDLIFMDINMPVMGGIECLTEIMKKPEIRHIIIIILSSDTKLAELTRQLGASAFINKPTDSTRLLNDIERMIHLDFIADKHIAEQTFQTACSAF